MSEARYGFSCREGVLAVSRLRVPAKAAKSQWRIDYTPYQILTVLIK